MKSLFKFNISSSFSTRKEADVLILPFWQGSKAIAAFKGYASTLIQRPIETKDFVGKKGQCLFLYADKEKEKRILLLGLGEQKTCNYLSIREAYYQAMEQCKAKKLQKINLFFPSYKKGSSSQLLQVIAETVFTSSYQFYENKQDTLLKDPIKEIQQINFVGVSEKMSDILKEAFVVAKGVFLTRDLINKNADEVTPEYLAKTSKSFEKISSKIKVKIFGKKELEKEKMGLLLAVNQGSHLDPKMIMISYVGNAKSKENIVFIGKGITYDTGGLSLKPTDNMIDMRSDMGGAATVLGAMYCAANLNLKVNMTVLVPSTENPIGSKSYKIGDVYRSYCGKTIEITNTDAEGRLALADAISYAVKNLKPKFIVNLATLTGAIVVALGEQMAGFFSNDEKLAKKIENSAKNTDELIWRMPLHLSYMDLLKSEVADMKNSAGRSASSIQAALFLKAFVKNVPWAHLDIAGVAFLNKTQSYMPSLATGYGLRLLIDLLKTA